MFGFFKEHFHSKGNKIKKLKNLTYNKQENENAFQLKEANHLKIMVMGAAGVGKTAIVEQFFYGTFPLCHSPTVGDMHRLKYAVDKKTIYLDVLDTSGTFHFPPMIDMSILRNDAFLLVYAINDLKSFHQIISLREYIHNLRQSDRKIPILVVGNKSDLEEDREVSKLITEFVVSIDWEDGFIETSAMYNRNIMEIFKVVLSLANVTDENLVAALERRQSLPVYMPPPKIKNALMSKRNSCQT